MEEIGEDKIYELSVTAPGPPAAVKVIATSVTSLAVSWLPPSRPNGPILYYTVFYRELGR